MTDVKQETYRNYVPFKTQLRNNLYLVVQWRLVKKVSLSMKLWSSGLMVFGGADPDTGYFVETSAFDFGFSRAHCKNSWAKIGAAPLTISCLIDTKVRQQLSNANDHTNYLMHDLQDANYLAVLQLNKRGLMEACSARVSRKYRKWRQSPSIILKFRLRHWQKQRLLGKSLPRLEVGMLHQMACSKTYNWA